MDNHSLIPSFGFRLVLTAVLCMAATVAQAAADTPANAPAAASGAAVQPAEPLEQLDEIWVRGRRLERAIVDAEDDLFRLYNKINKNDDFDIECGQAALRTGSMIMTRRCFPGFIAERLRPRSWGAAVSYSPSMTVYSGSPSASYSASNSSLTYSYSPLYVVYPFYPVSTEPSAELLLTARGVEYANNVWKTINSDPTLRGKYDNLVGLYHEMNAAQQRYVETREDNRKSGKSNPGPRAM